MGAAKVVAVGRDQRTLEKLRQLDSRRVVAAPLTGGLADDAQKIDKAGSGANLVVDASAAHAPEPTLACINSLGAQGVAVFVGGVRADIPLPYMNILRKQLTIRGSYMYPRFVPGELLRMIAPGVLDLSAVKIHAFPLEDINEALEQAPNFKGLEFCVIVT